MQSHIVTSAAYGIWKYSGTRRNCSQCFNSFMEGWFYFKKVFIGVRICVFPVDVVTAGRSYAQSSENCMWLNGMWFTRELLKIKCTCKFHMRVTRMPYNKQDRLKHNYRRMKYIYRIKALKVLTATGLQGGWKSRDNMKGITIVA